MSFKVTCGECGSNWTRIYTKLDTKFTWFSNRLIFKEYITYVDCKNCGHEQKVDFFTYE